MWFKNLKIYRLSTPLSNYADKLLAGLKRLAFQSGKKCTRLAMTWMDRTSFVLNDGLDFRRPPLDVLKEGADYSQNNEEKFDSDMVLMTGELAKLLDELVKALGGPKTTC